MRHLCTAAKMPALSSSSPRLLAQLQREDLALKDLTDCLKVDPCLGARLLHLANSPFFGVSRKIVSVGEAVIVLGLKQTRALIQVEVMRSTLSAYTWNIVPLHDFWHRSLTMAACAQTLANRVGLSEGLAFTAGIVHNLGMLVLAQHHPEEYSGLMVRQLQGAELARAEQTLFKVDHGLLGAELLGTWNLPQELCDAIGQQYRNDSGAVCDILLMVLKTAHCMTAFTEWSQLQAGTPRQLLDCCDISDKNHEDILAKVQATAKNWIDLAGDV